MASVAWVASTANIAFLWHNVIGAVVVVSSGFRQAWWLVQTDRNRASLGI